MREENEQAVVEMFKDLATRHLRTKSKRIGAKEVMSRVRAKFDLSRATVYRYLRRAKKDQHAVRRNETN